jgi:hypothetical protein
MANTHVQAQRITALASDACPTNRAETMLESLGLELIDGQVLDGSFGPGHAFDGDEGQEVAISVANAAVAAQDLFCERIVRFLVVRARFSYLWKTDLREVVRCRLRKHLLRSAAIRASGVSI